MDSDKMTHERIVGANWVLGSHLGAGSFAVVWKAYHKVTGQPAAVKEINLGKLNAKLKASLESEISILRRISHPNIVKLLEVVQESNRLYIIMEYCAGGDLSQLLRTVKKVPEDTARHLMTQLAAGLKAMWSHHLVHRDLKPQNLLLSEPSPHAVLKIADFGFARNLQPQGLAETLCGSPLYMAPEILKMQRYDAKADLWSVGAILFELVSGRPRFNGANQFALLKAIERSDAALPSDIAAQLTPACINLLHGLMRRNPVERISFQEFFSHPFLGLDHGPQEQNADDSQHQQQRVSVQGHGGLRASRSLGSMPQHIVGFQDPGKGLSNPPIAGTAAAGPAPASLPAGQLTSQLKPRRSMEDLKRHTSSGLPSSRQRHTQTTQHQQRHFNYNQGGYIRPLPFAVGTPSRVSPSPTPASFPTQDDGNGRSAPGLVAPTGPPPIESGECEQYSEEDDTSYVLVSATGMSQAPGSLASRSPLASSPDASPPLGASPTPPSPAPGKRAAMPAIHTQDQDGMGDEDEDVLEPFLLGRYQEAVGGEHHGHNESDLAGVVPWQGASRRQFLRAVGGILASLGDEALGAAQQGQSSKARSGSGPPGDPCAAIAASGRALSLHLAALQLFDLALGAAGADDEPAESHSCGSEDSTSATVLDLKEAAGVGLRRADAAATVMEEAREALMLHGGGSSVDTEMLPHPWEACRAAALGWAQDAAADELLGNYTRSEDLYSKAGTVLHFLAAEASSLELWPPATLAAGDETKLRQCAAAAAGRRAVCAALAVSQKRQGKFY